MSENEEEEARAAAAMLVYPYPCGAPSDYELLPVGGDGLGLPSYWCRACWGRAFRAGGNLEGAALLRLLRERGRCANSAGRATGSRPPEKGG